MKLASLFDRKFGSTFLESVPMEPGIYLVFDDQHHLVYVGKARNLRRRLSQYRNARRLKKHNKMRRVVKEGSKIELRQLPTEAHALVAELKVIQTLRPRLNCAQAFSHRYPYLGLSFSEGTFSIHYSERHPDSFASGTCQSEGVQWFGCFRSRKIAKQFYVSAARVLSWLGHRLPKGRRKGQVSFRRIPQTDRERWSRFLAGESEELLESLALVLLEIPEARKRAHQVGEDLRWMRLFSRVECRKLRRLLTKMPETNYPVAQSERDWLALKAKHLNQSQKHLSTLSRVSGSPIDPSVNLVVSDFNLPRIEDFNLTDLGLPPDSGHFL
jgi:hypothetical protein